MKTLCIASCGKSKIWDKQPHVGPTRAKNVYVGPFSGACGRYAEKFYPGSWCILSAKYGFVFPDELIPESYNVSFNDRRSNPISAVELCKQAQEKGLLEYVIINIISNRLLRVLLNYMNNNFEYNIYITLMAVFPFLLLNLVQVVGCWRSANKYRGKQIYRYLVYIFIVLSNLGRLGF